jgi:hypothetical protein
MREIKGRKNTVVRSFEAYDTQISLPHTWAECASFSAFLRWQ